MPELYLIFSLIVACVTLSYEQQCPYRQTIRAGDTCWNLWNSAGIIHFCFKI